jgi:hypothetical protein
MAQPHEKLLTLALLAMLGGCVQTTSDGKPFPFEGRVQKFSHPDEHGVVCYSYTNRTLSCVKVETADERR